MPPDRPGAVEALLRLQTSDADEVLREALGLRPRPPDLAGVELGERLGQHELPRERLGDPAGRDGVRRSLVRVLETDGEDMQNRSHECYFSAAHAAKDTGIALGLANSVGLSLPLAKATMEQYRRLVALGKGELDKSGIAELTFKDRLAGT